MTEYTAIKKILKVKPKRWEYTNHSIGWNFFHICYKNQDLYNIYNQFKSVEFNVTKDKDNELFNYISNLFEKVKEIEIYNKEKGHKKLQTLSEKTKEKTKELLKEKNYSIEVINKATEDKKFEEAYAELSKLK